MKIKNLKNNLVKHSPELLVALGICGMLTTTILSIRVTPKATKIVERKKAILKKEKLSAKETVKATWRCYTIPTITAASSITCIIGGVTLRNKRSAALATAYVLSETALRDYKNKVIDMIGEEENKKIEEAVSTETVNNRVRDEDIIITGHGDTRFYDTITGRCFKSDINYIRKVCNDLNKTMISDMYVSLNDFYYELGLSNVPLGDELGWNVNKSLIDVDFDACLNSNEMPCTVIKYVSKPEPNYTKI